MKRWLTEDPIGKFVMGALGTLIVSGLLDLKTKPVWINLFSACVAFLLGVAVGLWRRWLALIALVCLGAVAPLAFPYVSRTWRSLAYWWGAPHLLKGWGLILVALAPLALLTVVIIVLVWYSGRSGPVEPALLLWQQYCSDDIFGVTWHWRWNGSDIIRLNAFCPVTRCQNQLELGRHLERHQGRLYCDRCGFAVPAPDNATNWDHVRYRVEKEIRRRLNTGEYNRTLAHDGR